MHAETQSYFYVCNAFDDAVKQERQVVNDSPAASRKVSELCRAVRRAGGDARIVSLGRDRSRGSGTRYASRAGRIGGVPAIYLDFWDLPVLTHLATMLSLCVALLRRTSRGSVVVFYNYQLHYILGLVLCRLTGRRCVLDLEDGVCRDDRSLRGKLNILLLGCYNLFCRSGVMLASSSLAEQTASKNRFVCYGVARAGASAAQWERRPLQVLLGGSLLKETGAELLLETLKLMQREEPHLLSELRFVVTGFGPCAVLFEEQARGDMKAFLTFEGKVSTRRYKELLRQSHAGLCLKLPSTSMGATTFPSKVVELAASGLLLVSTRVSDVPLLFGEEGALLLPEATPRALADTLGSLARCPEEARVHAIRGRELVLGKLGEEQVGRSLLQFWQQCR